MKCLYKLSRQRQVVYIMVLPFFLSLRRCPLGRLLLQVLLLQRKRGICCGRAWANALKIAAPLWHHTHRPAAAIGEDALQILEQCHSLRHRTRRSERTLFVRPLVHQAPLRNLQERGAIERRRVDNINNVNHELRLHSHIEVRMPRERGACVDFDEPRSQRVVEHDIVPEQFEGGGVRDDVGLRRDEAANHHILYSSPELIRVNPFLREACPEMLESHLRSPDVLPRRITERRNALRSLREVLDR